MRVRWEVKRNKMEDRGTEAGGAIEEKKVAVIAVEVKEGKWDYSWRRCGRAFRVEDRNSKDEWTKTIEEVKKYLEEVKERDW